MTLSVLPQPVTIVIPYKTKHVSFALKDSQLAKSPLKLPLQSCYIEPLVFGLLDLRERKGASKTTTSNHRQVRTRMKQTQKNNRMAALWRNSHMNGANAHYVEQLFERYLDAPDTISEQWRHYFDTLVEDSNSHVPLSPIRERFRGQAGQRQRGIKSVPVSSREQLLIRHVQSWIDAWRQHGHRQAQLDPLALRITSPLKELHPATHGLTVSDMARDIDTRTLDLPLHLPARMTLTALQHWLMDNYAGALAVEAPLTDLNARSWWLAQIEAPQPPVSRAEQHALLERLTAADGFERYLAGRFPGAKRFGLEGCDALIPLVDALMHEAAGALSHVMIGMAHRGRLNVLVNALGKPAAAVIDEFEGLAPPSGSSGDVKYHLGYRSTRTFPKGTLACELVPNPSHLEIVTPVLQGAVRARQEQEGARVLPIAMHGDAAFAGQGVVMESLQMSQTRAFGIGGTVHIVINNQIGFTTSRADDARSARYCTDIAHMLQLPVLHVNADEPEAVLRAARLAFAWRQHSGQDVIIDLIGYRRRGHNEADEPSGTQPLMYAKIRQQPTAQQRYAEHLIAQGRINADHARQLADDYRVWLEHASSTPTAMSEATMPSALPLLTSESLVALGKRAFAMPRDFAVQRQVERVYEERQRMLLGDPLFNWGAAELLAYASLLAAGHPVRLVGQDSGRGTFSHRHAVVHDQQTDTAWVPLQHLSADQAPYAIYDSLLSEEAVLGFEYGYAATAPKVLVLWEAQFGDFANGAQVVIDQFIAAGNAKWGQCCGLVLLLPHGYEGQGPEHSSARPERFLQLCAEDNMQVCTPTTPAQIFHLLRRQAALSVPTPLVVMQPKSLLRHRLAVSSLDDLVQGVFHTVLPDCQATKNQVTRVVLSAGKVYYDLLAERDALNSQDTALIRVEQVYPFPVEDVVAQLAHYPQLSTLVWCQEEPRNQGYWQGVRDALDDVTTQLAGHVAVRYAGRQAAAAPATGNAHQHAEEQHRLVNDAFKV